jgi:hypothetical protein
MKNLRKNIDLLVILSFVVICFLLVAFWYKGVDFYGGGEEGLSLWRPGKSFLTAKNVWLDVGLGYSSPFIMPRVTFYAITALLNNVISSKSIQQLFFVVSMLTAFSGTYLLVKNFVKNNTSLAIFSGLFYIFNLYTQSQIFARFVYTGIIAWAFIPILLYLFAKWIKEGRFKHLIFFLIINLLASHSYSHPSYILIIWSLLGLWYLIFMLKSPNKLSQTKRFLGVLILWTATNIWWIYPMLKLAGSVAGNPSIRGWEYDYSTLQGLSRDFTSFDIFLLRQKYYFEKSGYWNQFYKTVVAYILSISGLFLMATGMFKKRFIKNKKYFVLLLFIGWFLSKGANFPFGNIFYKNLFRLLPYLGVFRNSYEKIGVIFLLPYAIFFAVGVLSIANLLNKEFKVVFQILVILLITGFLVWPMWTGNVFSSLAKVSVPEDYEKTNEFLNKFDSDLKVLSLPFVPGEGVNYTWKQGNYYGLEPSEFLFDKPFVSWIIPNIYAGNKSKEMINLLAENQLPDELLKELGIGFVVVHSDMNTLYSGAESLEETDKLVKSHQELEHFKKVGDLDVYSVRGVEEGLVFVEADCQHKPVVEYKKLNTRKYEVEIKEAQCPFKLILKNTFHDFWQAKIEESDLADHYLAYGYANGWSVNRQGDYKISIIFKIWPWE